MFTCTITLGAFRIGLRCLYMKQTSMKRSEPLFVPPAEAEQSRTELSYSKNNHTGGGGVDVKFDCLM